MAFGNFFCKYFCCNFKRLEKERAEKEFADKFSQQLQLDSNRLNIFDREEEEVDEFPGILQFIGIYRKTSNFVPNQNTLVPI